MRSAAIHRDDASPSSTGPDTAGVSHWVLVAGATRARLYGRGAAPAALTLIQTFEATPGPVRQEPVPRPGAGRVALPGAQVARPPATSLQRRRHLQFATQVSAYLEHGLADGRCRTITMVAACPFLGALRHTLSPAARLAASTVINEDLGDLDADELQGALARRDGMKRP